MKKYEKKQKQTITAYGIDRYDAADAGTACIYSSDRFGGAGIRCS